MAGASLLTLLDDITALLDDIATMSKVATKKTAGVLGDDLALNAQQVSGVNADRELPVVWAVAKGSMLNKAILVPAALLISAFIPWLITPLLMLGGLFLCFEGAEKLVHSKEEQPEHPALAEPLTPEAEKEKIKGAIRTDFILSAEIIVISLGTVATASFIHQLSVLSVIAVVMTVGVYGLVAGIVKLDDAGLFLLQRGVSAKSAMSRAMGRFLLTLAPWLMKALAVLGTIAMFLVGGGILVHGIVPLHHLIGHWGELAAQYGGLLETLVVNGANGIAGLIAGFVVVIALHLVKLLKK
ncbi:DUF808 domain-containing protein [Pseudoalteromonas sp. T1lg75]|uniref:DUF808 domain-containing protein n=1 Tax=Pseudoalteromonas sp. T1lg75 TaxID=2077102 RepID=UPI000CF73A46|nr:DUF808 domain-containing protein [Pseudoalteromonas sp. T1lg75]